MIVNLTNNSSVGFFHSLLQDELANKLKVKTELDDVYTISQLCSGFYCVETNDSRQIYLNRNEIVDYFLLTGDIIEVMVVE
jgi:hypothetical protein